MEIICTYGIPKVTEEAFIDYFQGCFLTYPHKTIFFSIGCISTILDIFGQKHSEGEDKGL